MNFKFWKKKPSEPEVETYAIPLSSIYRWYCYDLGISNTDKVDAAFGLTPVSPDGKDMEKEASEKRLRAILPLMPFIDTMALLNTTVLVESHAAAPSEVLGDLEISDHMLDMLSTVYSFVSRAAIVSTLSTAIELGLVHLPHAASFKATLIEEDTNDE